MGHGPGRTSRQDGGRGARDLDCDCHTINDTVLAYGQALLNADTKRIGQVMALGLDETLLCRQGRWRTQAWATSIVDRELGHPWTWSPAGTRALDEAEVLRSAVPTRLEDDVS